MSSYIQYHNYDKEGLYLGATPGRCGIHTKMPHVQDAEGGRVFVIFGIGTPRQYFLWESFVVDEIKEFTENDSSITFRATGPGWYLSPPQRLEGPEFDAFKKSCANFVGFRKVDELPFATTLRRLADQRRTPTSAATVQAFVRELKQLLPNDADRKRLSDHFSKAVTRSAKPSSEGRKKPETAIPQMRALSIRQPHAEAILRGTKKIEYRSRSTNIRGRIYIYASLGRYANEDELSMLEDYGITDITADELPRGVLVGTVELFDCDEGEWHVRNPERLEELVAPTQHPQPVWFKPF